MAVTPPTERTRTGRANISDAARVSGVSTTTVSHASTGNGPVAAATRLRVERAVRELQYRPNHVARNLRVGSSQMIAMVVPDITNPYYGSLTRGSSGYRKAKPESSSTRGNTQRLFSTSSGSVRITRPPARAATAGWAGRPERRRRRAGTASTPRWSPPTARRRSPGR